MMYDPLFEPYQFILASKSPRRQHLLKELGLRFEILDIDVNETYPEQLKGAEIATYLSKVKADAASANLLKPNIILITADTIVWLDDECIGKPSSKQDAVKILQRLSGRTHTVYSGICLRSATDEIIFSSETKVSFKQLSKAEIDFYIQYHRPYDKAGAYGIQDWIGYIGVSRIEGCYYNVMGFPVQLFHDKLLEFIGK